MASDEMSSVHATHRSFPTRRSSDLTIEPGDTVITGPLSAQLRADRDAHGTGRIYTIGVEAIDAAGNRSTATVTVTVPRSEEHTSELQSQSNLVCRLLLEENKIATPQ